MLYFSFVFGSAVAAVAQANLHLTIGIFAIGYVLTIGRFWFVHFCCCYCVHWMCAHAQMARRAWNARQNNEQRTFAYGPHYSLAIVAIAFMSWCHIQLANGLIRFILFFILFWIAGLNLCEFMIYAYIRVMGQSLLWWCTIEWEHLALVGQWFDALTFQGQILFSLFIDV